MTYTRRVAMMLSVAFLRLSTMHVQRISKLTSAYRVWRYVPLQCESRFVVQACVPHCIKNYGRHCDECVTRPRAGFGVQFGRLAFEVTYDER